jgi:hypothetical protein
MLWEIVSPTRAQLRVERGLIGAPRDGCAGHRASGDRHDAFPNALRVVPSGGSGRIAAISR